MLLNKIVSYSKRWKLALAVVVLLLIASTYQLLFRTVSDSAVSGVSGNWILPTKGVQEDRVVFKGTVLPVQSIDVTPAADGILDIMSVAWGDRVQKGQALFTVKSVELDQQLRDAQVASIKGKFEFEGQINPENSVEYQGVFRRQLQAINTLNKAKAKQQETQTLFDKGYVARNELDEAVQQVFSAQQDLQAVDQEVVVTKKKWEPEFKTAALLEQQTRTEKLERLQRLKASATVLSPMDGVVLYPIQTESKDSSTSREFKKGSTVTARDVVMTIGDTSSYTVRGQIGEVDMHWMRIGLLASIRMGSISTDASIEGRVSRIAAQAQPHNRGQAFAGSGGQSNPEFEIQVQLPAAGKQLPAQAAAAIRIGGSVNAEIVSRTHDESISIPVQSLRWDSNGKPFVLVRTGTVSRTEQRVVAISKMSASMAFISSGLDSNMLVWIPTSHDAKSIALEPAGMFGKLLQKITNDE